MRDEDEIRKLEGVLFGSSIEELREALSYDARLRTLWSAIEIGYCSSEFDLTKASRECGMSKSTLNETMKRLTGGHTCYELLTAYRVYRSILLALSENATFTEVALNCGFDNSSSYSRAVKRLLNLPPSTLLPRGSKLRRKLVVPTINTKIGGRIQVKAARREGDSNLLETAARSG
jgi:AraC-like DNA-binding protein